ncbi:zinc-dependent alcohol dehydrogenase family protein [Ferrimonas sp. SCSIO 43195]|uniref:zinc-dependent alcohol dehydrogenase family protein n=1 Tax=Ferrimonas sp. SCSIO 43195 TaxID=2822844 RepID=UPI002074B6EB|nr:zinc-dependent alcohol dehydrogenase family protein [Ferrimonas sp. SCSIO 43195]USD39484.1 zinc-dependent alcohol dehydrogenase family protein [Ferrimonas sp. SCSIO 43195]
MKAMILTTLGDADVLQLAERPIPTIVPGHLLIKVAASSVNPLDTMLRSADTPWSANLPEILHGDVAGTIVEVGAGVSGFDVGDAVYGCAGGIAGINGALAEYMLVDADLMAHKPQRLSMAEAAALPLVAITAWEALHQKLRIGAGDRVLVHGATGGVGHIAVQLAKQAGAIVSTTCRPATLAHATHLGADHVIDVSQESVADYVTRCTNGDGFDAVFDTIAGDNINNSFEAVRRNGAVATTLPIADPLPITLKSLSFHGVLMLLPMIHGEGRANHGQILRQVAELVDADKLTPLIDPNRFSLWQAGDAHRHLQSGQAVGKVVLTA